MPPVADEANDEQVAGSIAVGFFEVEGQIVEDSGRAVESIR
jgi:hypothetical protein